MANVMQIIYSIKTLIVLVISPAISIHVGYTVTYTTEDESSKKGVVFHYRVKVQKRAHLLAINS